MYLVRFYPDEVSLADEDKLLCAAHKFFYLKLSNLNQDKKLQELALKSATTMKKKKTEKKFVLISNADCFTQARNHENN